jgi:hypothetical protein
MLFFLRESVTRVWDINNPTHVNQEKGCQFIGMDSEGPWSRLA